MVLCLSIILTGCSSKPTNLKPSSLSASSSSGDYVFPHLSVPVSDVSSVCNAGDRIVCGWYSDTQKAYQLTLDADGRLHGECDAWHKNGQQMLSSTYDRGWPEGTVTLRDQFGNILGQEVWRNRIPLR